MEDIDGGLNPAVDGQSLDEDEDEDRSHSFKEKDLSSPKRLVMTPPVQNV